MGGGVLGLEADIAHSPDFFGRTDLAGSSVLTATGSLLIGIPRRRSDWRRFSSAYGLAGVGVIRSKVDGLRGVPSADDTKAAWEFGGGAMFFFGTHVGLRVDLRYFRTFSPLDLIDVLDSRERLVSPEPPPA